MDSEKKIGGLSAGGGTGWAVKSGGSHPVSIKLRREKSAGEKNGWGCTTTEIRWSRTRAT